MKTEASQKILEQIEVVNLTKKINKRNYLLKNRVSLLNKSGVVIRMGDIKELSPCGVDNVLDLLRSCFVQQSSVAITEMNSSLSRLFPDMRCVRYFSTFEEGLDYINEATAIEEEVPFSSQLLTT